MAQMNQQLIPIIAAYWGCECSYDFNEAVPFLDEKEDWGGVNSLVDEQTVCRLVNFGEEDFKNFKLHLRPLWSITEDELRELFVWHGYKSEYLFIEASFAQKRIAAYDRALLLISDSKVISPHFASHLNVVGLINKLREWQFCMDNELVDANLVEWKEVGNG